MIREDRKQLLNYALGAAMMIVIIQTMVAVRSGIFDGLLLGTDTYQWLIRVQQLHGTGNWFDATIPRIDPPYGFEQHWTRPFDVLLFTGAWLGAPLIGFKNALHAWGALISPVLQILALIAFFWALLPLFANRQIDMLGILFASQVTIVASFMAGRPDHQSFIYLLFILSLGLAIRLILQPFRLRLCYAAGFFSGIAVWVSIESLLIVLVNLVCLGLIWLWKEDQMDRKLFYYSLSLFVTSTLALFVQKGWGRLWESTLDQISIVYVILFGLISVFWAFVCAMGGEAKRRMRLVLALAGVLTLSTFMALLFPGFFSEPFAKVDDLYRRVCLVNIAELQPVLSMDWKLGLSRFFLWLGIAIPTIPALIYHLVKRRKPDVRFWAYVSVGLIIYAPLALLRHIRFVTYVGILLLPGYAWLIARIVQTMEGRLSRRRVMLLRPLLLITCATWFILPGFLLAHKDDRSNTGNRNPLAPISQYLDDPKEWGDRPRNILAFADFGSELLYRTKHNVYSIQTHRFQRGFTDSYHIMSASEDEVAHEIIRERRVELIMVYMPLEDHLYLRKDGLETFYDRLLLGKIPAWVREVELPDDVCRDFRLYEVSLFQTT